MRRFLSRYPDGGGQALVIDPGTLSPALYLSGLPNDGVSAPGGNFATWTDKISGTNFAPSVGSAGITAFNDGSIGLAPGVWGVSICGGSFFRGFNNAGLAAFPNTNGYTQYVLLSGIGAQAAAANYGFFWPSGGNGLRLVYQGTGFCGGPPGDAIWTLGAGCPGMASKIAITDGSTGFDTGIISPAGNNRYDLWTLVSDGSANTTLYRNGVVGPTINTGAVGLATNLQFGGPSSGANFICQLVSAYIMYTSQHTPGQIAGVHAWVRAKYGAS